MTMYKKRAEAGVLGDKKDKYMKDLHVAWDER